MTHNNDPADCHICARQAIGVGIGWTSPQDKDPRWICAQCVPYIEQIKSIRRMSPYELKARAGGMNAAAPILEQWGTDLSEYTEEQALMLCGAIWDGCGDELRRLIRSNEAPF